MTTMEVLSNSHLVAGKSKYRSDPFQIFLMVLGGEICIFIYLLQPVIAHMITGRCPRYFSFYEEK